MKNLAALFLCLVPGIFASAQRCGTDEFIREWQSQHPENQQEHEQYINALSQINHPGKNLQKKAEILTIPVVFHVVHNYGSENISKAQILEQLEILNQDFRRRNADTSITRDIFKDRAVDTEIEFRLANIDPKGNCTDGITRTASDLTYGGDEAVKKLVGWDYRKYLNVWVIHHIGMKTENGIVAGYSRFPYQTSSLQDGIVIDHRYVGKSGTSNATVAGRTLTHEIGHWLGLLHPFQSGCGTDNCEDSGDMICDTPPVDGPSFGCPLGNNTCDNDSKDEPDMVENFMDYANGSCQNMFTQGQKEVMRHFLSEWIYRGANVSESNLASVGAFRSEACAPVADFNTHDAVNHVCPGQSLTFKDYSWNGNITAYEWTFEGGSPATSVSSQPVIAYSIPGNYKVTLKVTNDQGTSSLTKESFITVIPSGGVWASPFEEDFDGIYSKDLWQGETNGKYGWRLKTDAAYSGKTSMVCFIDNDIEEGTTFNLYSPYFNLSKHLDLSPILSMRTAYSLRKSGTGEKLNVYATSDCGHTWRLLKTFVGATTLYSKSDYNPAWLPETSDDWKVLEVPLDRFDLDKQNEVRLRLEFVSGPGGNEVFIDDINVDQFALSEHTEERLAKPTIWPNPSSGQLSIQNPTNLSGQLTIYDVTGQLITTQTLAPSSVSSHVLPGSGVYVVHTTLGDHFFTERVIVTQ
ncbi:MAG: PKD domain-containing protein [Flavobacteriales bacterium]|nr:PKD domain-containing protein [Flavobacteriales bacterium]